MKISEVISKINRAVSSYRKLRNAALRSRPFGRFGPFPVPKDMSLFIWCPLVPGEGAVPSNWRPWCSFGGGVVCCTSTRLGVLGGVERDTQSGHVHNEET